MLRAKLSAKAIEFLATLRDYSDIDESGDDSNTDYTWQPQNVPNDGASDVLDSDTPINNF